MGKLVVGTFLTLDGVYQAPGGQDEDREGGFAYGGWTAPFWDDEMGARMVEIVAASDALLLGRKTYDMFAGYWPTADPADPIAAHINGVPRYVASHSLESSDWAGTTILSGDVAEEVARLKDQHQQIGVPGSGDLIQTLLRHDLVDEFNLWTFPVVVGSGKRLFGDGALPAGLKLTGSWTSGTGVVVTDYARAGEVQTGQVGG